MGNRHDIWPINSNGFWLQRECYQKIFNNLLYFNESKKMEQKFAEGCGTCAKTAPRLERLGLKTVGDVRRLSLDELRRHLGARVGTQFHLQARGIASDQVYPAIERKSISKETTFAADVHGSGGAQGYLTLGSAGGRLPWPP
jgi:thiol-disulfide isomerase/thioredoxin